MRSCSVAAIPADISRKRFKLRARSQQLGAVFMRLFIALDIDDAIRQRIARFIEGVRGFAPDARWVQPESLHVTLKFIGEKPEPAAEQIKQALETVSSSALELQFRNYGFFPSAKSARVFWVGIAAGPQLASLAATVDEKVA